MIAPAKALNRQIGTLLGRLTILGLIPTTTLRGELRTLLGRLTILVIAPTKALNRQIRTLLGRLTILGIIAPAGILNGKIITFIGLTILVTLSSTLDIEIRTVFALVIAVRLLPGGR